MMKVNGGPKGEDAAALEAVKAALKSAQDLGATVQTIHLLAAIASRRCLESHALCWRSVALAVPVVAVAAALHLLGIHF